MTTLLDAKALAEHKRHNAWTSLFLILAIGGLLATASWLVWGANGVVMTAVWLLLMALISARLPLEGLMHLYRAQRFAPGQGSQVTALVAELATRSGLPRTPTLFVIPSLTLNAFATGTPSRSAIAITEGLLRKLTLREITGVLAHEMSHIRHNDLWVMTIADLMTRFSVVLSYLAVMLAVMNLFAALSADQVVSWWVVLILYVTPAISSLLQLGLSRTREFNADAEAARLTGDPLGLASALRRLDHDVGRFWEDLMLPVPSRRVAIPSLLRSHPPTEERIERLLALKLPDAPPPTTPIEEPLISLVGFGPAQMRPRYRWPGVWF